MFIFNIPLLLSLPSISNLHHYEIASRTYLGFITVLQRRDPQVQISSPLGPPNSYRVCLDILPVFILRGYMSLIVPRFLGKKDRH